MDSGEIITSLRTILELGYPAIITIAAVVLWRENKRMKDDGTEFMRGRIDSLERRNEILLGLLIDRNRQMPRNPEMHDPDGILSN